MATTSGSARPRPGRWLLGVFTAAVMATSGLVTAPTATAAETVRTQNSYLTITTAGWGHGRGMSQYGAWGAAKQGLKYDKILAFYYPGTKLGKLTSGSSIRVWLKANPSKNLYVYSAKGLIIKDSKGKKFTLPNDKNHNKWRISRSGSKYVLWYRDAAKKYKKYTNKKFTLDPTKTWSFENPKSGTVKLYLAAGNRTYRGSLSLAVGDSGTITVNTVPVESYLRSVVPAEMPPSWSTEALKAQAVAARSYAARYKANLKGKKAYDICDTTACQVYKGTSAEYKTTDAAIKATATKVLTYQGQYAWTEFSSSNGGYSVAGTDPYIKAKADPYDLAMNQVYATS
ncbi:MAG: SpoIID/LytB domain-containing protein, partial [Propionicimonas sp.]|nr:SpoIID/LytB domain-containing protein [Propionicimonas sp.]